MPERPAREYTRPGRRARDHHRRGTAAARDKNVTDPRGVVSAYYGDIESGNYAQACALIGGGATTGQSYQDFVAGFYRGGAQGVSENRESGDQVNFDPAATDSRSA